MNEIEVWFEDLTKTKQQELLDGFGVKTPQEMNWDVYPLFTMDPSLMTDEYGFSETDEGEIPFA